MYNTGNLSHAEVGRVCPSEPRLYNQYLRQIFAYENIQKLA